MSSPIVRGRGPRRHGCRRCRKRWCESARRLREVAAAALAAALEARIGAESDVLVEQPGRGRAAFYASVTVPEAAVPGTVRRMRLVASDGRTLVGEPVP